MNLIRNRKYFSTIFKKIIDKKIDAEVIYETEKILVINDIAPTAPIHCLIIPKKEIINIDSCEEEDTQILGELLYTAKILAKKLNVENGYRIVINNGLHGCQSVNHIHLHFIAGKQLGWPPGTNNLNTKI